MLSPNSAPLLGLAGQLPIMCLMVKSCACLAALLVFRFIGQVRGRALVSLLVVVLDPYCGFSWHYVESMMGRSSYPSQAPGGESPVPVRSTLSVALSATLCLWRAGSDSAGARSRAGRSARRRLSSTVATRALRLRPRRPARSSGTRRVAGAGASPPTPAAVAGPGSASLPSSSRGRYRKVLRPLEAKSSGSTTPARPANSSQ
jgi:hypothetical protein